MRVYFGTIGAEIQIVSSIIQWNTSSQYAFSTQKHYFSDSSSQRFRVLQQPKES